MGRDPLKILLMVVIGAGVLVAVNLGLMRIQLEQDNRQVELAVEYREVQRLARWSGISPEDMLSRIEEKGATAVVFKEETVAQLETEVLAVKSGAAILLEYGLAQEDVPGLNPGSAYIVTAREDTYHRLVDQLTYKVHGFETIELDGVYLLTSTLGPGELRALPVGFNEAGIRAAREAGLNIILQVQNWPQATPDGVVGVVGKALATEGLTALLFNDGVLPGYPKSLEGLLQELRKTPVPVGIIEFFPQQGLNQVLQNLDKRGVRLHALGEQEIAKLTPQRAIDRFALAATERNNRILLTRFFFRPEVQDWAEYNLNYLQALRDRLEQEGLTLGPAKPFSPLVNSRMNLFWIGLAVIAGGVILLKKFLPPPWAWGLGLIGALGWLGLLILNMGDIGRLVMALAAVVIFPSLSLIHHLKEEGAGVGGSIGLLLVTSLYSFLGAVLMVGLLADVNFMLKLDQFRGVKLAHVVPLMLVVLFCLLWQEKERWYVKLRSLWKTNISVGWSALAVLLAVALLIYVSRTGNESAAVSGLELRIRTLLDQLLVVRPRTKEFLVGHPMLMLFFYLGYRHRYLPVLIFGAIGQVSLVNTFAHVHTPLLVSLLRAVNGLWLGIVLGLVLIAGYRLTVKLGERLENG
jgi:hypothetical protein